MAAGYSRRKILGMGARSLLAAGALTSLPKDVQAKVVGDNKDEIYERGLSICQGLTNETSTQLSIDVPKDLNLHYRLLDPNSGRAMNSVKTIRATRVFSSWAVDQVAFDNLRLGVNYLFHVLDEKGNLIDERELQTVDLSNKSARIAVLSCMFDMSPFKGGIWETMGQTNPDYCFFIGDNVYGDLGGFKPGPKMLWRRYIETRKNIGFYHQKKLKPVLALWDDHDFGKNNANHKYRHKQDSLDVFNSFFPRAPIAGVYEQGPGCSSVFKAFGHDFVFLDNRFHRDEGIAYTKSFWGQSQFEFVQNQIMSSRNPKWMLQGSQFFGEYLGKDQTFETKRYREEFDQAMRMLKNTNQPNLFLSGDVHFSEVMDIERSKVGFRTYELTSSHTHSFKARGVGKNPRRRSLIRESNFMIVDLMPVMYGEVYEVRSIRKNGDIAMRDFLQVY